MENWKKEIEKLEKIRVDLQINFNSLEKLTGVNRSQLKKMFTCLNMPGLELFLNVKNVLESQKHLKGAQSILAESDVIVTENKECDCTIDDKGILRRGKSKCKKTKSEHFI